MSGFETSPGLQYPRLERTHSAAEEVLGGVESGEPGDSAAQLVQELPGLSGLGQGDQALADWQCPAGAVQKEDPPANAA